MKRFSDEIMIGIGMTLATLIVIVGVLYLSNSNFLKKGLGIKLVVHQAGALTTGDDVMYKGVQIGSVKAIDIEKGHVVIHLKLERLKEIPKDSKFIIKQKNILGEMMIDIEPGISKSYLPDGALVAGEYHAGMAKLSQKADVLSSEAVRVLQETRQLLDKGNAAGIAAGVAHLDNSVKTLEEILAANQKQINTIIHNLKSGSQQLAGLQDTSKQSVARVIHNLEKNTQELSLLLGRSHKASQALDSILTSINHGQGTLGKLVKDDSLYIHMNRTFKNLDWILKEVRKNPGKMLNVKVRLF